MSNGMTIFICKKCDKPVLEFTDMQFETGSPWHNYEVECHGEKEILQIDRYVLGRARRIFAFTGSLQRTIDDL